jgi:WD40 repeat protein
MTSYKLMKLKILNDNNRKSHRAWMLRVNPAFCSAVAAVVVLLLGSLFFFTFSRKEAEPSAVPARTINDAGNSIEQRLPDNISGKVVYLWKGAVYIRDLERNAQPRFIALGGWPRWSPDGTYIGYVSGNRIMLIPERGGEAKILATAEKARALAFSPDGRSLFFTDGTALRSVDINGNKVKTVLGGYMFREIDAAGDPVRVAATVRKRFGYSVHTFDLQNGEHRTVATGCSASLSPDGGLVTVNGKTHRILYLYDWNSLSRVGGVKAPAGEKFDNQSWSNSPYWLASVSEGSSDIYIHQLQQESAYRVTRTGDCDRPDLFITSLP